jgi:hypothetical protein
VRIHDAAFRESPIVGTGYALLCLALGALGADYPAYGACQQSASPYIEEFAGSASDKLLKGKIYGRIGAALDQITPLVHYWDGYGVEVVSSSSYSALSL